MTVDLPQVEMSVKDEQHLLDIIGGQAGKFGPGLRTYPQAYAAHQQQLHQVCLALQARGLVKGREAGSCWLWSRA